MEVQAQILEPVEKRERKLTIEWPEKDKLLSDRDRYVQEHQVEVSEKIIREYPGMDPARVKQIARLYSNATFMIGEMQKISPIPFEVPIVVKDKFHESRYAITSASFSINPDRSSTPLMTEGEFFVSIDGINYLNEAETSNFRVLEEARKLRKGGMPQKEAIGKVMADRNRRVADLDVRLLSSGVHEFAHLLYLQECFNKKSFKRIIGLKENKAKSVTQKAYGWSDELHKYYISMDLEIKARIWELDFLKHYFPDCEYRRIVEKELVDGQQTRRERLAETGV